MRLGESSLIDDEPQPLVQLPVGRHVRIVEIRGGRELARRLLGLGLRVGVELDLLHRRGRGVVVGRSGIRVALGAGVAEKLYVVPLD
jgi:ferrous iron transport protein A